jgi:ABC-type molybdate transport system substrate-binding protein
MMEDKMFLICITTIIVVGILSVTTFNVNQNILMSDNIDKAVSKGIDPLSVRCAYTHQQDTICVAHAASSKNIVVETSKK